MATGTIAGAAFAQMPGLNPRTIDSSALGWVLGLPLVQDVGYVTKPKIFTIWLWNGTGGDIVLSSIAANSDGDGITWSATPPDAIEAGGTLRIDITVGVEGPLAYSALLSFLSACGFDPALTIIGTRAPVLSGDVGYLFWPHNWEDGLDETLVWKTDVLIARDRTEQRVQLRTKPRRTWDLRLLVAGAGRRKLESWLGMRKARYLFVPAWPDQGRVAANISAGDTTVSIEVRGYNYTDGSWLVVWEDPNHYEIRKIIGIGGNYLSVETPFNRDWSRSSTFIAPGRYCLSLEPRRVTRFTEDVSDYRVLVEPVNDSFSPSGSVTQTYRGLPVCPLVPSFTAGEESYDNKWVRLDNDTGLVEFDIQSVEPIFRREVVLLAFGQDRIDTLTTFLFNRAGRLAPFWLAATDRGFELTVPAHTGATVLTIAPIDYEYTLQGSPSRTHIELVTTGGSVIRRMITAVATLPSGEEQVTLDSALPTDVSAATLNRCAWLELVRLDSDEVKLHWVTADCLTVTLPIVVLP